jgi:excisionase family DNA binding protein
MTDFEKYIADKIARLESLITEKSNRLDFPAWLSVKQCAEYLGVCESQIRKLVGSGSIPYRRVGQALRFNRRQVDLAILSGTVRPNKRLAEQYKPILEV